MTSGGSQSIGEVFLGQLANQPDAMALLAPCGGQLRCFTWRRLAQLVCIALEQFDQRHIDRGAHIASWLPNGLAWIVIDLACQLRGAVHVALDSRLPMATALRFARHADAQLLFTEDELYEEIVSASSEESPAVLNFQTWMDAETPRNSGSSIPQALQVPATFDEKERLSRYARLPGQPEAAAQILYTSGTMSEPKGVMLSHRNLLSNAQAKLAAAPQSATDVRLNILPFAHAYARTCELSTWISSGSLLCIARTWAEFLRLGPHIRPTLVNLVPHLAQKLVVALDEVENQAGSGRAGERLLGDRLRLLQVGGAALPRTVWDRLAREGWPPLQGYGLTEASPVICSNRAGDQRPDSVGTSVPGVELRLDQSGVLWTRGPHVMLGYWKAPQETAAKIQDGWLCTGDLAEATDDGRWRILGRADDQICLATGYKASPHELVRRLAQEPWVEQLVIVGQDRPHLAALVYPRWSVLPEELFDRPAGDESAPLSSRLCTSRFQRALVERWSVAQADLPRQLRIQRVGVLREPLVSENGGLNFKGAVRRKFVEQVLLAEQIAELYSDSPSICSDIRASQADSAVGNVEHGFADIDPNRELR